MIAYDKLGKVTISPDHPVHGKVKGIAYFAHGEGCIGQGGTPREALQDWRAARQSLDWLKQ
jgi:hypothetical protein